MAVAGLLLESIVETALREPWIVALALVGGGAALYAADRLGNVKNAAGRSLVVWLAIAVAQVGALVPGVSRSGLAITVGRALGVGRLESTKFSFLLMAPAIVGAAALRGFRLAQSGAASDELAILGLGVVLSGVSGFFAARWLLGYVSNNGFGAFALYRAALGIAVLLLLAILRLSRARQPPDAEMQSGITEEFGHPHLPCVIPAPFIVIPAKAGIQRPNA